jgi:hypothetical protein
MDALSARLAVHAGIRQHQALPRHGTDLHELDTLLLQVVHGGPE